MKNSWTRLFILIVVLIGLTGNSSAVKSTFMCDDSLPSNGDYRYTSYSFIPAQDIVITKLDSTNQWHNSGVHYDLRRNSDDYLVGSTDNTGSDYASFTGSDVGEIDGGTRYNIIARDTGASSYYCSTDADYDNTYFTNENSDYTCDSTGDSCTYTGGETWDFRGIFFIDAWKITGSDSEFSDSVGKNEFKITEAGVANRWSGDGGVSSCQITHDDGDGNSYTDTGTVVTGYGNSDEVTCSLVIDYTSYSGYERGEKIHFDQVQYTDDDETISTTLNDYHRIPNLFVRVRDSNENLVTNEQVTVYDKGTSTITSAGSDGSDTCSDNTNSNGWFSCGLPPNSEYDIDIGSLPRVYDIDIDAEGTDRRIQYEQYDSSEFSEYEYLNFTGINQTGELLQNVNFTVYKAGTDNELFTTMQNTNDAELEIPFDKRTIYRVRIDSPNYQNHLVFRNVKSPDLIEFGRNQNFVPESTLSNSLKFSAGHVLPAQTMITRPFSDFDVVNVSVEKTLDSSYRMVSDVLVRKYNVDFPGSWQSWSNRKTVTVQDIYNRNWDDSGGEMNNAWGVITFNPEGFQNNDCSDVRLTDKNNNVQDFTVNTCQDDYVEMEFNAPINALQEKEFYIYYGNSGATDAQTAVQRPSETRQFDMETGKTGTSERYFYQDNNGGTKGFNTTIPQNIDFIARSMTVEGDRTKPKTNNLPVTLGTDYQDFTGMEIEPKRRYILQGITIQMANTTVDSELVIRNQTSGNNILVKGIPDNGAGQYFINYTNESIQRAGENLVFSPGDRFLVFVRYGEARRASNAETQRPMFNLTDTVFHRQLFSLNSDGTGGTEGDYPVLVSQIDTIDPEYPTNVTITHENTGQQVYNGPDQLNNQQTIDLTSFLDSVVWREGDPLDNPKLHEFSVDSDTDGNLSLTFDTRVEFEHPVLTVSKTASGCSVNPESQTYFHIDRSDCSYLDRVNVSQGQWFRLDYRFRTPGPNDFNSPGDTNSYNISDTMVRFDILQETEEFTSG